MLCGRCRLWQRDEIDEASKKHDCSRYVLLLLVRLSIDHSAEEEYGHHLCAFGQSLCGEADITQSIVLTIGRGEVCGGDDGIRPELRGGSGPRESVSFRNTA